MLFGTVLGCFLRDQSSPTGWLNFKDELENDLDRVRLLGYMSDHPKVVMGVVNAENGVIYRASRDWRRRLLSYLMLLAVVLLGFVLVFVMTNMDAWLGIEDWKPADRFPELATVYVFLLLGAVAHLLIGSLKQTREKTGSGLVAVEDWLLWLHVKESALLMTVSYIWVGAIALAFSLTGIQWGGLRYLWATASTVSSTSFFSGFPNACCRDSINAKEARWRDTELRKLFRLRWVTCNLNGSIARSWPAGGDAGRRQRGDEPHTQDR